MSIFIDRESVRELTGCARKADQIAVLRKQGIQFYINRSGWPVVPKTAFEVRKIEKKTNEWNPGVFK